MNLLNLSNTRLADILPRGKNNFDFIRLSAALAVIFGHAFYLHPSHGRIEPMLYLSGVDYSGSLAVDVFFFISGILITRSYAESHSALRFIILRLGRIWPALAVCVLMTTFVIGPIVTTLPSNEYAKRPETLQYLLTNICMYKTQFALPGVFENNLLKTGVNGSLWTIPVEVRCYLFVLAAGLMGCLSNRSTLNFTCLAAIFAYYLLGEKTEYFADILKVKACGPFLLGALCFANRDSIPLDWKCLLGLYLMWFFFRTSDYKYYLFILFLLYSVIFVAGQTLICRIKLPGDFSYGVYLYGFLTQQLLAKYFPLVGSYRSLVFTWTISLLAGVISWYVVEMHCLRLARNLADRADRRKAKETTEQCSAEKIVEQIPVEQ